jgi:hypothetical protein
MTARFSPWPILLLASTACGGAASTAPGAVLTPAPRQARVDAAPAIVLLQNARFDEAEAKAGEIVAADAESSQAHAVLALALFKRTVHQLIQDIMAVAMGAAQLGGFNHQYARFALENAEAGFKAVDDHLAIAGTDSGFNLNLCFACWQYDWNHSGDIDWRDQRMFEVEYDADGRELPEKDPRRKPTFRLDTGDVYWARAWLAFQRAALNIVLAYKWTELDKILQELQHSQVEDLVITIHLEDKGRITKAKALILAGFALADFARQSYLAETDDENEWLPNPRQKSHALPLPVDDKLYETWAGVLGDATRLVEGKEGVSIAELAQLGEQPWKQPPTGFLNVGKLLDEPGDLVFKGATFKAIDHADQDNPQPIENALKEIFGEKYVKKMPPTPLIARLQRMKKEMERGEESLERKLRYLLWLN